jgi:two-component system, OmpR family, sensor histidine kinase KdpD
MPSWVASLAWGRRRGVFVVAAALASLSLATAMVALLQGAPLHAPNASAVYLVAVVAVAIVGGTWAAVACSIASFLLYDFLFVDPIGSLTVAQPGEWLNLVLFLLVAAAIGQLTALQAARADDAARRARESQALFRISRTLATSDSVAAVAPAILAGLVTDAGLDRAWLSTLDGARERTVADSAAGTAPPVSSMASTLTRRPGDEPARWVRAHLTPGAAPRQPSPACLFRVAVVADDTPTGYLWGVRARETGDPTREETRLLALAADQLGLALKREALAREATAAEVARQSEALKTALLDSVSHDLRTPLATIRAAAGALLDPTLQWSAVERQQTAQTIDNEAQRLDRIVHNVLDMSRLEAGVLRPELEVVPVDEVVRPVVARLAGSLGSRLTVSIPEDLPPVLVDAVYMDEALTNLLENAVHHGGPDVPIAVSARPAGPERVAITVEDGGAGVPDEAMPRLFEKFYRVRQRGGPSRRGLGIGLSVVKGMVEAMDGHVSAAPSPLGGLAVTLDLPAASGPPEEPRPAPAPSA